MDSIQSKIEALTQELRPYKGRYFFFNPLNGLIEETSTQWTPISLNVFASTNKAEVEEYADCYKRLKLYQLLGKKAEKKFPPDWNDLSQYKYGTDFVLLVQTEDVISETGQVSFEDRRICVLSGVWFSREEDRLEALKICGIDKAFQEKCAKYGLGGA